MSHSNPGPSAADRVRATIDNCEDEPIRIPGSIQRHGFLLLLDSTGESVAAASQNAEEFLEVPLNLILGTPIDTILDREVLGAVKNLYAGNEPAGVQTYLGSFALRGGFYSVVTHRLGDERVLEFERLDRLVSPDMANQVFTNFVSKLSGLRDETMLCDALVEQIKNLTGFDRILLSRFDEAGHGTVLSEVNDGVLPSYLDLRFPASDIPAQARELYILNTVRIIPDAGYTPSPLQGLAKRPMRNLDLSMSILRSVSPIHVEYMRNMGTLSSMSVSLVIDGKLWGLVSAHHATPRLAPYLVRSACDLLAKLVCTQIMNFRASAHLKKALQFHAVQRRVLTRMAGEKDFVETLAGSMENILQITEGQGVALAIDGKTYVAGLTPSAEEISQITTWLEAQPECEMFHTRNLAEQLPAAAAFAARASGLLAICVSSVRHSYLMWFRPEAVSMVKWAGQPKASDAATQQQLTPRTSFEIWKEMVREQSDPWGEMEIESATEFRAALTTINLKRVEEALQLNEARFLQLTHTLPNAVWTADNEGRLTYVNQTWVDQGLVAEGLWHDQPAIMEEDRQRCFETWQASIAEGKPFECELRLGATSEQHERWNLLRMIPYLKGDNTLAGWVGTATDLTDRRERETALRITEKLALTGRMTSVIAHEINNPLEALMNLLYLVGSHTSDDPDARRYLALANSEVQRISAITKQTLRWSKEKIGAAESGNAAALFQDVLQLYAGKIRNQNITVVQQGHADVPFYGAVNQISQVISNLIANSIQALPMNGRISIGAELLPDTDGRRMEIFVRDEGHGMSEETLRQLFQPFFSTKGDLGNGLGLYISKEIVERNHGTLSVTSELGKGTEVRIQLPTQAP